MTDEQGPDWAVRRLARLRREAKAIIDSESGHDDEASRIRVGLARDVIRWIDGHYDEDHP